MVCVAQRETGAGQAPWTVRSVTIVVSDLDRSVRFYEHVLGLGAAARDAESALLSRDPGGPSILLRQAYRNARRPGAQGIGLQAVAFEVDGPEALDELEARLREMGAFERREAVGPQGRCEVVRGRDPDRVPLEFLVISEALGRRDLESLRSRIYDL